MRRTLEIIVSSFKMAMQELWKNKLRTFLSLFGITIGIFCIIGVLATVNSLEHNIQNEIKAFGNNTIYVMKFEFGGGMDYPWWKYVNRPEPKYFEVNQIAARTPSAKHVAYVINTGGSVEYGNNSLSGVTYYGVSEQFSDIQDFTISHGRYVSESDFAHGSNVVAIGNDVAEKVFGSAEFAIDKMLSVKGRKVQVIGVIKKQGQGMIGGWNFDASIIMPYKYARTVINEQWAEKFIMVEGADDLSIAALKDELKGTMRAVRRLKPVQDDNFALNDVNEFSDAVSSVFGPMNLIGWFIAGISLIVGMFGVANIMFVTVKERTSQIGLKKAVGAKSRVILAEFLLESSFLCIIGGLIGLLLVFLLTQILSNVLHFPIYISTKNFAIAIFICILVGVLAGIIPASQAARMDPVVAIRSK
jgi:putative ABC transport system permease protein